MLTDKIFELLTESFKVQNHKRINERLYTFKINDKEYFVTFEILDMKFELPTKAFEVRFSRKKGSKRKDAVEYGINTKDVDATDVYWTVADIIKDHYEKSKKLSALGYQKIAYYFNAARSDKDEDMPQRAKITNRIIKRYLSLNNLDIEIIHGDTDQLIILDI